jgi:hypothetical protein
VEDMRLAGKDRLLTHSINLDCHLGSPLAATEMKYCKKYIKDEQNEDSESTTLQSS